MMNLCGSLLALILLGIMQKVYFGSQLSFGNKKDLAITVIEY